MQYEPFWISGVTNLLRWNGVEIVEIPNTEGLSPSKFLDQFMDAF